MTRPLALPLRAPPFALLIALLALMLGAIALGSAGLLPSGDALLEIAGLRAHRVLGAALVGAALGLGGTLMQTLLANELADPYVLGLSGGASLGAVLSLLLLPSLPPGLLAAPLAFGAALWVVRISRERAPSETLLAGVVLGAVLSAGTGLVLMLAPAASFARSANHWLFGGLAQPSLAELLTLGLALLVAGLWTVRRASHLDRLSLGRDAAHMLGVDLARFAPQVLLLSALLTSLAVGLGGLIGFVGLAAPHLARSLFGAAHQRLVPTSMWLGAFSLVIADAAARTLCSPRELPVGLLTAVVLGPLTLILRRGAR